MSTLGPMLGNSSINWSSYCFNLGLTLSVGHNNKPGHIILGAHINEQELILLGFNISTLGHMLLWGLCQ